MESVIIDRPKHVSHGTGALITIISVFFFWGFVASSNDILIPVFKQAISLSQTQSQMISFAFYVAYTIGSLIYLLLSRIAGSDLLEKLGYRNGLAIGLVISALGTLLFIPAANSASFPLLISGLFIVGLGFSLQQTAANTIMIVLGDPAKASQRLSLAGGINNIGTTIGPVVVAIAIFGLHHDTTTALNLQSVKIPYLILGAAFIAAAVAFKFSSIPDHLQTDTDPSHELHTGVAIERGPLSYPQLSLGMIAIFLYVGVEVSTASNLPEYLKQHSGIDSSQVAPYVSLFWASLMIGRWTSAAGALNIGSTMKSVLNIALPFAAFGIFLLINMVRSVDLSIFYPYLGMIPLLIGVDFLSKGLPARQLMYYSIAGILSLLIGMSTSGIVSAYAFIGVGLFCSTLWPCIFTMAIHGLGKNANKGASYLIMMIMGGGIVSLLQGFLSDDRLLGIKHSYWVGVFCFLYLFYYAWRMRKINFSSIA